MSRLASRRFQVAVLIGAAIAAAGPAPADVVERRGGEPTLEGDITRHDETGVTVQTASGADHHIPWDRVRWIRSDDPLLARSRFMEMAVDLWRARSRIERGDTRLAEPLLERLFEQTRGRTDATARVAAEGLLRCRLARGANALALIPALETARLDRAGVTIESYASLAPVIDPDSALCPQLAPAFVPTRALDRAERELAAYDAKGDAVIGTIARLYLRAVRQHLGRAPSTDEADAADPAVVKGELGAGFLAILVDCASPDADLRAAARARAERQLATAPRWAAGWTRFAIGDSLLRESGVGRRQRGLVQLLHLPAEHRSSLPFLAGLALSRGAEASRADGDETTARVLSEALTRSFPNHPVRSLSPIPPA